MQQRLTEAWYRERARPSLLTPLAWLYGALMRTRRRAYVSGWVRTERAGKPVVVVGNLTVGGTGKTPLTIWLARQLLEQGLKVGIVSRGYGRRGAAPRPVQSTCDWRQVGDEPLIIARRSACPTIVARDRVAGARALVAGGADVILADDGLQHLRLGRDCEIVEHRFADHPRFVPAGRAFADGLPVLMTEKDAVKCLAFAEPRLWYVPVAAQFGAREAHELLARVLAKVRPASVAGGRI